MFPGSSRTRQLLLYTGCFLLSLPPDAPRHAAAAPPPFSFSFDFSNQSLYDRNDLRLDGNATVATNLIDLTCNNLEQPIRDCTGRISYIRPVPFYNRNRATDEVASFSTLFTFKILREQQATKGDGMAFFLAGYPSVIPPDSYGGGLGLITRSANTTVDGARRFVAVVFDTYTFNVSSDHIAIALNTVKNPVKTTTVPSPGLIGTMTASINFTSSTRMLVARLHFDDDLSAQPVEVSTMLPDPVTSLLPPEVAVGFSAATGANTELHQLLSWSFNSTLAPPKKPISAGMCLSLYLSE
jgi:hypothetical protein